MILHIPHFKQVVPDSDRDIFVFLYIALQKELLGRQVYRLVV